MFDALCLRVPMTRQSEPRALAHLIAESDHARRTSPRQRLLLRAYRECLPRSGRETGYVRIQSNGFDLGSMTALRCHLDRLGIDLANVKIAWTECCVDLAAPTHLVQNSIVLPRVRNFVYYGMDDRPNEASEHDVEVEDHQTGQHNIRTFYQGSRRGPQLKIYNLGFRDPSGAMDGYTRIELVARHKSRCSLGELRTWVLEAKVFDRLRWISAPTLHGGEVDDHDLYALGMVRAAELLNRPLPMAVRNRALWSNHDHVAVLMKRLNVKPPPVEQCFQRSVARFFHGTDDAPLSGLIFDQRGAVVSEVPHSIIRSRQKPKRSHATDEGVPR